MSAKLVSVVGRGDFVCFTEVLKLKGVEMFGCGGGSCFLDDKLILPSDGIL